MKAILFTQEDTEGFDALQQKIHLYLIAKENHKYSASCWANSATAIVHEDKLCMPIDESEPRYSLILEALDQSEIDAIQEITIEDNI
jgi:hypothetical protein